MGGSCCQGQGGAWFTSTDQQDSNNCVLPAPAALGLHPLCRRLCPLRLRRRRRPALGPAARPAAAAAATRSLLLLLRRPAPLPRVLGFMPRLPPRPAPPGRPPTLSCAAAVPLALQQVLQHLPAKGLRQEPRGLVRLPARAKGQRRGGMKPRFWSAQCFRRVLLASSQ